MKRTNIKQNLKNTFPGTLFHEPLKNYCNLRIGGPAKYLYKAKKTQDLFDIINFAKKNGIRFKVIGSGTNILFDDKGYNGLIIKIETNEIQCGDTEILAETEILADSGVLITQLIAASHKYGLEGLENWAGLPGTVGGAVYGNAGCHGLETKDILKSALLFNPENGMIYKVHKNHFDFSYRSSKLKESGEILINAVFRLKKSEKTAEELQKNMEKYRGERKESQPYGLSAGSFFKNPSPEKPAGMLIDNCGLKGKKVGRAQISEKHGNFFINPGGATFKDMISLKNLAQKEVKEKFGIDLKEEVQIISAEE